MLVRSWLDALKSHVTRQPTRRQRRAAGLGGRSRHLHVESLEDRRLMAFDTAVGYPAGNSPQAVITADFNNDGRLDVATANSGSSNVNVLVGNADGTFQPAQQSPAGNSPSSLAVGDFNADGKLDLATVNAYAAGAEPSMLLGNGNGTFQAPTSIGIGSNSVSVAVGDFNNDGKLDLALTSNVSVFDGCGSYGCYYHVESRANVLLGNGLGSFAAPIASYLGDGYHAAAAVADFNGDGKLDIASTYRDSGIIEVSLGTGTGAFGSPAGFGAGADPYKLAAGDVSGDGKVDLVATNLLGNTVSVLLGNGLGSFRTAQPYATVTQPTSLALADFNGDRNIDLATVDWSSDTLSVLLGAGGGTFKVPVNVAAGAYPRGVAVGDFNADGRPDAVTANLGSDDVSVLLNDGTWPALVAPSITINDAPAVTEGNAGTVNASFTVSLSAQSSQPVTVVYATADGSATAGSDYQSQTNTLTFAPGETSKPVSIAVNGDRLGESTEYFSVKLSNPTGAFIADSSGTGTILDDEPRVSVGNLSGVEGNTGTTAFTFNVTLSAAYDAPVTVAYATADVPRYYGPGATAGVDYTAASGTVTFAAGDTSRPVTVLVNGDRLAEDSESFFVRLTNPTNAFIATAEGFGTILDDEPSITIDCCVSGIEGNAGTTALTFNVTLLAAYDAPVTVAYSTADLTPDEEYYNGPGATAGVDYTANSGTVTFNPGEPLTQNITVLVTGDRVAEADELFWVNLGGSTSAHITSRALAYIEDDEPRTSINSASVIEGHTGTAAMIFTVTLSAASDAPVTVDFATSDGSATVTGGDYQATSGTVTFAIGQTTQTISVPVKGDRISEYDEYFYVNLGTGYSGYGTIVDDEPRISIGDVTKREGRKNTTLLTFTVTLSAAYDQPVTMWYRTVDGTATTGDSDYVAKTGTLTFAPGETTKTVTIEVNGDSKREANETFYLDLSDTSGTSIFTKKRGTGTILNDD
jgi:Calx-beta domain/FG-GAP-like repeat